MAFDIYDGETRELAASHGHYPDNTEVAGIRNIAMFAGQDGVIDALAIDGDYDALPSH